MARARTHVARPVEVPARRTPPFVWGLVGGAVAGIAMAMVAMLLSLVQDKGLLTPVYHIASIGVGPAPMEASMSAGMAGDVFFWDTGPAMAGLFIHMGTAMVWGIVFAAFASSAVLRGGGLLGIGLLYGLAVMLLMAYILLPVGASLFDAGPEVSDMALMAGRGVFTAEHLTYGLVLGIAGWIATRARPTFDRVAA